MKESESTKTSQPERNELREGLATKQESVVESTVEEKDPILEEIEKVKKDLEVFKKGMDDLREICNSFDKEKKDNTQRIGGIEADANTKTTGQIERIIGTLTVVLSKKKETFESLGKEIDNINTNIKIDENIKTSSDFAKTVSRLKLLLKEGSVLQTEILEINLEKTTLTENYTKRKLLELGAHEDEDHWSLRLRKYQERNKKEGFIGIKKIFNKADLDRINREIESIDKISILNNQDYAFYYLDNNKHKLNSSIYYFENIISTLEKPVIENIAESLKETSSEEEIMLQPEQVDRLKDEYMRSFVLPKIEKDREGLNEEEYDQVLHCIRKSMSVGKNATGVMLDNNRIKISEFNAEIEKLDYRLRSKIEKYRANEPVDIELEKSISLINKVDFSENKKEFENIVELYNKTMGPYQNIHMYDVLGYKTLEYNKELSKDIFQIDTSIFKMIENDDYVLHLFGRNKIEKTKDFIQKAFIKKIFEKSGPNSSREITPNIGEMLIKLGDSKYSTFIIMNSFRESGYQNDYPLINVDKNSDSILGDYVKKLSTEDIDDIKNKNIPGLYELVVCVQKNPDKIWQFKVHDSFLDDEGLKNKQFINENFGKILQYQAQNCIPENLKFYLDLAVKVDCDLDKFYNILESVDDDNVIEDIISMAEYKLSKFKDVKIYELLLSLQKKGKGTKKIPQIFLNYFGDHYTSLKSDESDTFLNLAKESADIGVMSDNLEVKTCSIQLLNTLGLDIKDYTDFIAKDVFEKELAQGYSFERIRFFMKSIENESLVFDEKQVVRICECIITKIISRTFMSDNSEFINIIKLLYNKQCVTEEYYKKILHLSDLTDNKATVELLLQGKITQENWAIGLSRYTMVDAGVLCLSSDDSQKILELFSNNHPDHREICLKNLQKDWKEFLKTGTLSVDSMFIANICKKSDGMGDLKYIENISYMIYYINNYLTSEKSNKKTANTILTKLGEQEERFKKDNWSEEDKSFFYSVSKDILSTSPSLYTDFLDVFEKLQPRDMKVFVKDYFASYQATLVVLDKGDNQYDARELVSVRQQIREVKDQIKPGIKTKDIFDKDREKTVEFLKEKFVKKYGIVKIPEQFDQEKIKILENFIKYNSNINGKDKDKDAILAFYMALSLNGDWQRFREGQKIDPESYINGENLKIVKDKLSSRKPYEFIKSFDFDIQETEIPELMKILEDDTISSSIGNIETVDVKLGNIKRAMIDLEDIDAYEHEEDKQVLELYKKEGKLIASTLSKMFSVSKGHGDLSQKEEEIKKALSSIYKIEDWNQEEVKKVQESTRGIGLIHGILEKINKEEIDEKIHILENILKPNNKIIEIFSKLDEDFKPNSGAVALSEDLIYLENIIVKNQDKLTKEEQGELSTYLDSIRSHMNVLEKTVDNLKEYFDKLKKSIHGSNKLRLQEKLQEIEKIIYSNNKSINLVSRMTGSLSDVIMNIRQCLGCLSSQCNNDTNLTFGEPYKFLMLSQNGAANESIADQLVMCLPITLENGEKTMSFIIDTAYGVKSADVLFGNIKTINKKRAAIKQRFPNIKTSVTVTNSTLASVGLPEVDLFIQRYKKDNPESLLEASVVSIDIPRSALGDNYAEYGVGSVRPVGKYDNLYGVVIE